MSRTLTAKHEVQKEPAGPGQLNRCNQGTGSERGTVRINLFSCVLEILGQHALVASV